MFRGCPFKHINRRKAGGEARLKGHVDLFYDLLSNARHVMNYARSVGVKIAFELSSRCDYWSSDCINQLLFRELGLETVVVVGCSVGLVSKSKQMCGAPIGKAWKIATDCSDLIRNLSGLTCPGRSVHTVHAHTPRAGS